MAKTFYPRPWGIVLAVVAVCGITVSCSNTSATPTQTEKVVQVKECDSSRDPMFRKHNDPDDSKWWTKAEAQKCRIADVEKAKQRMDWSQQGGEEVRTGIDAMVAAQDCEKLQTLFDLTETSNADMLHYLNTEMTYAGCYDKIL